MSKIKEITGGDEISARALYGNPITYRPQFSLFVQMNDEPELSKIDGGIARRIRKVEFPFVFKMNPVLDHERQANTDIKERKVRSIEWRNEFILMLIETFNT